LQRPDLRARTAGPPIRFAGTLGEAHRTRTALLQRICDRFGDEVGIWATEADTLPPLLRARYQGRASGADFFRVLAGARIVVNAHIDVAGDHADNMRMFEATGVGAMLLTDAKVNLPNIFEVGREVVAYDGPEACVAAIEQYLEDEPSREAIAGAGQQRTLSEHTYLNRMHDLTRVVGECL